MTFARLLDIATKHLDIIASVDKRVQYTQLVIGEMHYLPNVQCEVLKTLCVVRNKLGLELIGKEGLPTKSVFIPIDLEKAANDEQYMHGLLIQKINAVMAFGNTYPKTKIKAIDDPYLHKLSGYIDKRCHELFLQKKNRSMQGMTHEESIQYNYWFSLLKDILLGGRSDFMVRNLYSLQRRLDASFSVLLCGAAHTPYREEYRPYSVIRMLQVLPINYIVAITPSVRNFLKQKDAFDFYSSSDESEVNPYHISYT